MAGQAPSWKVLEDDDCYAFLDINPVSRYHTLIIPKVHARDMFDVTADQAVRIMAMVKKVIDLYATKLSLENCQVVCSSGAEAQQDVFHIHYHVVPRKLSDGQNIVWKTHPQWRNEFDGMLEDLA